MSPAVFHLEQAIVAIRKEIAAVPPHSTARETLLGELGQLHTMLHRRATA